MEHSKPRQGYDGLTARLIERMGPAATKGDLKSFRVEGLGFRV